MTLKQKRIHRVGRYHVFTRTWWRENPTWPNGLEPHPGDRLTVGYADTEEDARAFCREYNAKHAPGRLSLKAEYEDTRRAE